MAAVAKALNVTALFKKSGTAKKAAKAAPAPPSTKYFSRGGWTGGDAEYNLGKWYGPDRSLFLPSGFIEPDEVPSYLNGEMAGDYGYDPLGLGKNGTDKYQANELLHGRWAMLGTLGAIFPEIIATFGDKDAYPGAVWFQTGAVMLSSEPIKYFGFTNPLPLVVVAAIQVAIFAAVEKYRSDNDSPIGSFADELHPGGPYFDPLGLASDPDAFAELKVKEIKNGRLAMVSMLGFAVQAAVTGEGPYAAWRGHLADPFGYNLLTILRDQNAAQ